MEHLLQVNTEQAGYWIGFPMSSPPLLDAICSPKAKGGGDLSMSADDAPVKVFFFATQSLAF